MFGNYVLDNSGVMKRKEYGNWKMIIEDGISNKSFAIFAVSILAAIGSMMVFLDWAPTTPTWLQLVEALGTLTLFGISLAAWMGKFDKKPEPIKAPEGYDPRLDKVVTEDEPPKVKPAPKEDWADKWLEKVK